MSYTTWDVETTTHPHLKRKASPFTGINWVVTHGFKKKGDTLVTEHRFGRSRPSHGWLKPVLAGTRLLVGFNIKFDLLHALQDAENLEAWMEYVAGGGNVWDCQLAEYLLCGMGQRDQILSLDEVAPRYGGNIKVDEVKALWAAGVDTPDIEPELLSRYLCGGNDEAGQWQLGDVENTEKIALAQIARAREAGQLTSVLLNMGSLLCSIEMERNGMFVDMPLGLQLAGELKVEVDKLHEELQKYLPPDLPFEFKWSSRFHKSALIFGGTVGYAAHQYDLAPTLLQPEGGTIFKQDYDIEVASGFKPFIKYAQMDEVHCYLAEAGPNGYNEGDLCPLWYAKTHDLMVQRYGAGKKKGEVKTKNVKVDDPSKPKGRMARTTYTFPRMTDPSKAWETAEPGVWSVSNEVIEALGNRDIPFLKALATLTAMTKDLGTYFIVTDEDGKQKGMLSLVDEHGIIHHKINHTSTVTARFSSSDPNLTNIPKENKSKVKLVFVSRFGPDGKIIQSDFYSLEVYIQAILTKCKQLILDLKAGLDMHCLRLSNSPAGEGHTYEELLILCKGDETVTPKIEPVPKWYYARTDSKVYSFQAAYGAGDAKIADTNGMPQERVAALRAADDARYPEIETYFAARTVEIKQNRKPSGTVIPHPEVPGIICNLGRSSVRTPDGKLYSYMESPSPAYLVKRGTFTSFSPTEIKNYEVQGEGGEWAKAAMWLSVRAYYVRRNFDGRALLVNMVHDALYADAHKDVSFEAAATLHACMEAASEYMEFLFKWEIPVPVPSATSWGPNMMDDESVPGIKERATEIRKELRDLYMGGYKPSFETQATKEAS